LGHHTHCRAHIRNVGPVEFAGRLFLRDDFQAIDPRECDYERISGGTQFSLPNKARKLRQDIRCLDLNSVFEFAEHQAALFQPCVQIVGTLLDFVQYLDGRHKTPLRNQFLQLAPEDGKVFYRVTFLPSGNQGTRIDAVNIHRPAGHSAI
jgi:hypothetical protein